MPMIQPQTAEQHMRRALRLAARGRHASPNPMVGCVLVAPDGRVVGEGYHPQAGEPHAEVFALRAAGAAARGATAYVTLEPCSHQGRTPPCADALLTAGVRRVVAAMTDPDPRVAGHGLERLRAGGVIVEVGLRETEAHALNAAFIKHRLTGRPWVVLKTAMTLDGKIATREGHSRWITSPIARRAVHRQLRDRCDAIVTGVGTVLADDPSLTTRLEHRRGRDPLRVIVDSTGRTPLDARVVQKAALDGKTLIVTTPAAPHDRRDALAARGCQILVCASDVAGRVDLAELVAHLGTHSDVIGVLIESGGELAAGFLQANLVDRWLAFVAPKIVGGRNAPGPVEGGGVANMDDALLVSPWRVSRCGPDLRIDGRIG